MFEPFGLTEPIVDGSAYAALLLLVYRPRHLLLNICLPADRSPTTRASSKQEVVSKNNFTSTRDSCHQDKVCSAVDRYSSPPVARTLSTTSAASSAECRGLLRSRLETLIAFAYNEAMQMMSNYEHPRCTQTYFSAA